jgi:diguanylate cyclase (GGDEF)-like protein/PAS domain S-box-containing protein
VWGDERYAVIVPNVTRALKGERVNYEYRFVDTTGRERQVLANYVPDVDAGGTVRGFFVLGTDVTTLARARQELQDAHERLANALEGSSATLWDADLRTGRVYLNETWARLLGSPSGETFTTTQALAGGVAHPSDLPAIRQASIDALKGHKNYSVEHRVRTATGEWRWVLSRGRVTERDAATGRALRMVGTNLDITEQKEAEEKLKSATQTDPLTGLANRTLLMDRIRLAMARTLRTGSLSALLYLDIDRFKEVNDSFGHAAGDAVLRGFSARLRACVRQTDTVARLGGDEFVVLLEDLKDAGDAQRIADKILLESQRPVQLAERTVDARASIGLAAARGDADEAAWLARADAALYRAKHAGRNRISVAM